MSLFGMPRWLRNFVRKRTKPIEEGNAHKNKQKLSILYAILAWNAFGFVVYSIYKGKADWAQFHGLKSEEELKMSPGQAWAKTLGIKKATVYRIDGMNFSKYEVDNSVETNEGVESTAVN